MKMRKTILILMAAVALVQTPLTVMAHGHHHGHGGGYYRTQAYAQCNVEGCALTGIHEHDGAYYCGHFIGDGHYHGMCTVEGCAEIVEHIHDGMVCTPYCTVEGCGAGNYCGYHCGVY